MGGGEGGGVAKKILVRFNHYIMDNVFREVLKQYTDAIFSTRKPISSDDAFFNKWFREHGKAYTFVFKKNLKVTNIQFAELISLVRDNVTSQKGKVDIQFLTVNEFIDKFSKLYNTFFTKEIYRNKKQLGHVFELFEKNYKEIFEKFIVSDTFYGTCGIFLPYHLNLDLGKICYLSGYIHSCGSNIYTRKIYKATEEEFYDKLHQFVTRHKLRSIPFTLYCHEDFTPFDRAEGESFFHDGLDDIKFYAEKLFIGNTPLPLVIKHMQADTRFKGFLDISIPGDYHKNIKGNSTNSIWLISDRSINNFEPKPGQYKYFICYQQEYINENPFYLFDENKPGWIDHVTIPHTLMSAMLNISLTNINTSHGEVNVLDPFVGSGTTLFELAKYNHIKFFGSDINSVTQSIIEDNITFFSLRKNELQSLVDNVIKFKIYVYQTYLNENAKIEVEDKIKITKKMLAIVRFLHPNEEIKAVLKKYKRGTSSFSRLIDLVNRTIRNKKYADEQYVFAMLLQLESLDERILFYTALKAIKRKSQAIFVRKSITTNLAYVKELDDLTDGIRNLIKLKARLEKRGEKFPSSIESCKTYLGNYSKAVSIKPERLKSFYSSCQIRGKIDVRKIFEEGNEQGRVYNIIITDPPYGFNTTEEILNFSELFGKTIEAMIENLADYGQIIICLPDWSHTGRQMAYFTQRQIIIHQVIHYAKKHNRKIISPYKSIPKPNYLFKPPYYWEYEKAIRRSIMHFSFKH